MKNLDDIVCDKFGRRVILYLLAGRSRKYFAIDVLKELEAGDAVREKKR